MTLNAPKVKVPKLKIPKIAGLPKQASTALTETRLTPPDYILGLDMSLSAHRMVSVQRQDWSPSGAGLGAQSQPSPRR